MHNKLAASLLIVVMPSAALAEPVELRSIDGFISVKGEVVEFNGVMLEVDTSIGRVSVPASEVSCYGAACAQLLAENAFGLTAANLQGVFSGDVAVADTVVDQREDSLTITFDAPGYQALFDRLAAAFAVADETLSTTDVAVPGVVMMQDETGNATAVLTVEEDNASGDVAIMTVGLNGSRDLQYPSSLDWALTMQPTHQMLSLDAFAVIVAGNVPVDAISVEQLAGIYAGEIRNWSEIGGPDVNILPLQLPAGSPTRNDLIHTVMEPFGKTIAGTVLTMADEKSIATSVGQFPGSISVLALANLGDNKTLGVSGSCGVAVAPTAFNIASGDYPLLRPIMAEYGQPTNIPLVRELFDFAAAKVAQDLFASDGFVGQDIVVQDQLEKNTRLNTLLNTTMGETERLVAAQLFQDLFTADRLSATMYGGPTSGPEGAWNRAMFHHLEDLLKTAAYEGREILFVGYAKSANGPEASIQVSREAASVMRDAFTQFATETVLNNGLRVTALGFGAIAPATCYGGQVTNNAYSRVEVWVR